MFASVNSYAEAIYLLCANFRPLPATVLVRPLVEIFINSRYILGHNSDRRLWLFVMDSTYDKLGLSEELGKYEKKYPNKMSEDMKKIIEAKNIPLSELKIFSEYTGIPLRSRKKFQKEYGNLHSRALKVDRRSKKGELEYVYLLAYRYLSQFSHLGIDGIKDFVEKDTDGNFRVKASQSNDSVLVLATTYTIYHYFLFEIRKRKLFNIKFSLTIFEKFWEDNFIKKSIEQK